MLTQPSKDFLLEVSKGNVSGHQMFSIPGKKIGVSATALDDISSIPGTLIIPDPGGIQLQLVSSSANDSSAGTGIRTIMVVYLDTAGDQQSEIVTMNGTTGVNTVATDIDKIQWMHATTVGSLETAGGAISLQNTAGTITYDYILASSNQSLTAHYHIPTGKTGYIIGWQASGITKVTDVFLRATVMRSNRSLITAFVFQDMMSLDTSPSGWIPFRAPLKCPAGSTIKVSANSKAAGGDVGTQFDILLVDN